MTSNPFAPVTAAPKPSAAPSVAFNSAPVNYNIETSTLSGLNASPVSGQPLSFDLNSALFDTSSFLPNITGYGGGQISQTFASPISNIDLPFMPTPSSIVPLITPPINPLPQAAATVSQRPATTAAQPSQQSQTIAPSPPPATIPFEPAPYDGPTIREYTQSDINNRFDVVNSRLDVVRHFGLWHTDEATRLIDEHEFLQPLTSANKPLQLPGESVSAKDVGKALFDAADAWQEEKQKQDASRPVNRSNNRRNNFTQRPTTIRAQVRGGGS